MTGKQNEHSPERLQLGCLLAAGGLAALSILGEAIPRTLTFYLTEYCLLIPCVLFLGVTWTAEVTPFGKRRLTFGIAAAVWMILIQLAHLIVFREVDNFQLYAAPCLIALPFASVYRKGDSRKGLEWITGLYVAAALLLAAGAMLLKFGTVPPRASRMIYWDGVRLHVLWHPNITACLLMIAMTVCMADALETRQVWRKLLAGGAVVLFYYCMALCNGRTTQLLTSVIMAGLLFFKVAQKGGWKRAVVGLVLAAVLVPALYVGATAIYDRHEAVMQAAFREQQEAQQNAQTSPAAEPDPTEETQLRTTKKQSAPTSGDRSLERDLGTLNGRLKFWKAALKALRAEPGIWLRGVYDSGETFTAYGTFKNPDHTHNSWLEVLFQQGLVGLLFALTMTGAALVGGARILLSRQTTIGQKSMAMLIPALLGSGFLEPVLFTNSPYYHFIYFFFCLGLGYVDLWSHALTSEKK